MSLAEKCNTLITNDFHLADLPVIRERVREAVRLHAQDNSYDSFPEEFKCSHCGNEHALTPEEVKNALFTGPGQVDLVASSNEYMAILNKTPVASAGEDYNNGVSRSSSFNVAEVIKKNVEELKAAEEKEAKTKAEAAKVTTRAKSS